MLAYSILYLSENEVSHVVFNLKMSKNANMQEAVMIFLDNKPRTTV